MDDRELGPQGEQALEQVLGYLNFSTGIPDSQFLAHLNTIFGGLLEHRTVEFRSLEHEKSDVAPSEPASSEPASSEPASSEPASSKPASSKPVWLALIHRLEAKLAQLAEHKSTFRDSAQGAAVLKLAREHVLPGYLEFHRDLLFHQTAESLFTPYFLGRVFEAILRQGGPWEECERITKSAITHLNDYIGHRPVAALESQKIEPYPHEWVRPIPLYVRGAEVAVGPHREVIETALRLLRETDIDLLRSAQFDPQALDELAVDPRAYDFDHPVNKRPNYHFGQWDPHQIDNQGRYRRYVVQQITLVSLMKRIDESNDLPREEAVFEAGAVLAGTIIMASGISGYGPEAHDSSVTLSNLLPKIAKYRDTFYERLLSRAEPARAKRLRAEAVERKQPFGGARQHINQELARCRASQLEHVHLANIFARMGYRDAAARQANVVPAASARMMCQIDCWLTEGHQAIRVGDPDNAAAMMPKVTDMLRRAIECGAAIDPWNILGFDAHFSLFPSLENSVHDHRADDLCLRMENIFALYSQIWSEAAARDDQSLSRRISLEFQEMANWWNKFATHEVSSVEAVNPMDAYRAAERVAGALNLWHKGGAAAGDVAFWAPHAEMFDSPQAYTLVLETLLKKNDYVASMALLVHWLGQADRVGLESGESSFHRLAEHWLQQLLQVAATSAVVPPGKPSPAKQVQRFFDYLEANAESYWHIPNFELADGTATGNGTHRGGDNSQLDGGETGMDDDDDGDRELFDAAYESVVYRDTTDDGIEGAIFETDDSSRDELSSEYRRLSARLAFHSGLARMWRLAALNPVFVGVSSQTTPETKTTNVNSQLGILNHWSAQAAINYDKLLELLDSVRAYRIPAPNATHDAMIEFDQKRLTKEAILEAIVATAVDMAEAKRLLISSVSLAGGSEEATQALLDEPHDQRLATQVRSAMLGGNVAHILSMWPTLLESLRSQPLLYVSLTKGGRPREMIAARVRQRTIQDLLAGLPRLGLFRETCELIDVAREMEKNHPVGPGAVTEFDEMFRVGLKALVESLLNSADTWTTHTAKTKKGRQKASGAVHRKVVECLERITEALLMIWLEHSRTLRLSVLEKIHDKATWKRVISFIEEFGGDLFTQRFLNAANIRSILHQGVDEWLQRLQEDGNEEDQFQLLNELDVKIPRSEAVEHLTLILDAVYENYGEYRDYNSTTTQSDRGELLYTLLDFLRLRSKYDRVSWNLKPVMWVHDVLVRRGYEEAAKTWRRALSDRINDEADQYMIRLAEIQKKYSMRMPTVADRLAERFIRPMTIDRIRALVAPAMEEVADPGDKVSFDLLELETESLTLNPSGAGLDIPAWIVALEEEVERARQPFADQQDLGELQSLIPQKILTYDEVLQRMTAWSERKRTDE